MLTSELSHCVGQPVPLDGSPDLLTARGDVERTLGLQSLGQSLRKNKLKLQKKILQVLKNIILGIEHYDAEIKAFYAISANFVVRIWPSVQIVHKDSRFLRNLNAE